MIYPGLTSITFRPLKPSEIVDLVVEAGLKGVEWGGDIHVPHGDLETARQVGQMTTDAGLHVAAYGSYYRAGHDNELSFERVLETAIELHAPVIRVWAGNRGSDDADEEYRSIVTTDSRRIADMAAAEGIRISYEFHGRTLTDTNESAGRLLRDVGHPGVGTFWQPPVYRDADYCLEGLNSVLPWLSNVHAFHWWPTPEDRHPLAEGRERWERYLRAVQSTGRDHFVLIEYVEDDEQDAFMKDAATLKEWLRLRSGRI